MSHVCFRCMMSKKTKLSQPAALARDSTALAGAAGRESEVVSRNAWLRSAVLECFDRKLPHPSLLRGVSMKTRRRLALALGFAAILAVGGFVAAGRLPADADGRKAEEKEPLAKGRRAEFIAAFNKGDAKAVASFWTPDATYVDQVGREYKGRTAIEQLYEKTFAARKGAKLAIHVPAAKLLSPDVAMEDGVTEVTPSEGGLGTSARFSAILVKKDGEWYLQSVRDSVDHPPSNAEHLEDLEWLIGEWTGETEKGESAKASYDWAENQNFIVSSFATTVDGVPVGGGTQWIGWEPR